jgi:hypothetical protein
MPPLRQYSPADRFLQGCFVLVFVVAMGVDFYQMLRFAWQSLLIR